MKSSQKKNNKATVKKIPVTVLTGFLGSGKTTLLNYILNQDHGLRIAVIENEFGEVGVDDELVDKKVFGKEELIEMNNGCICCTVRGDLINFLTKLIETKSDKFDYVLIETTGLADPAPVAQTFFVDEKIAKHYVLDSILTLIDAKHIEQHLDDIKAEGVENEAVEQIAFADRILLNKIDLVSREHLEHLKTRIHAINKNVKIYETQNSIINLEMIMGIGAFNLDSVLAIEPDFMENTDHQHDLTVSSVGLIFEGDLNKFKLDFWMDKLLETKGTDLFRYKGIIAIKGDDRKYIFQGIHMLFMETPAEKWKSDKRQNKICFIGRNLDRKELTDGIMSCVETLPLRFKVGDRVECNLGQDVWEEGTVIRLWDQCNSYRVKLDSGDDVWASIDSDDYITGITDATEDVDLTEA